MKVLQLIDSLRPGGAEQMAVSYANALARKGVDSYLCCTRMEGLLKKRLEPEVGYLFLEKKHSLDNKAFMRLREFVKEYKIQIIQAHSSSYFLAVMVKWVVPGVKVIWHDHYGRALGERNGKALKLMARYFDGIFSVNEALKTWADENLAAKNVVYIKNFLPFLDEPSDILRVPKLKGEHIIKIICVANLRPQKDHFNLIKAFELVLNEYSDVSLHLVGKYEENNYSKEIKSYINERDLQKNIFLYGEQENVGGLVKQATIGILSSSSEGLPLALLEYGQAGLPVVCTRVGECEQVIGSFGKISPPKDPNKLMEAVLYYITNKKRREEDSISFHNKIISEFSEEAIIPSVIDLFQDIIKHQI